MLLKTIASFGDKWTERLWNRERVKKFSMIADEALESLVMINNATSLNDLAFPPSNDLHKLKGDRKGQWAISIGNTQYRVCFYWGKDQRAYSVEITKHYG